MEIKKYNNPQDVKDAFESCNTKKSDLWDNGICISFREYDCVGNTTVFHGFYY